MIDAKDIASSIQKNYIDNLKIFENTNNESRCDLDTYRVIANHPRYKSFYSCREVDKLTNAYIACLKDISDALCNESFNRKTKILNVLEYMRFMVMYEKYPVKYQDYDISISYLSQAGIIPAFLGKGVCGSQAEFMQDTLLYGTTEKAYQKCWSDYMNARNHSAVFATNSDSNVYIDPTAYYGTPRSIAVWEYFCQTIYSDLPILYFKSTPIEVMASRKNATEYIFRKLGINDIANTLSLNSLNDLDKQTTILEYLKSRYVDPLYPEREKMNCKTIDINGFEIEADKAFELFLVHSKIPYFILDKLPIRSLPSKANIVIDMEVLGVRCSLATNYILNNNGEIGNLWYINGTPPKDLRAIDNSFSEAIYQSFAGAKKRVKQACSGLPKFIKNIH